ncbi:hypothetical protein [Prevotella intermedia]|uniref:Uncharacterized protein n=1 Tax=Prevotella intermedia TaxID=28131 RepID=A0A2D3LMM3_PREIN|nr:hypothetical protein [Prevotella intermedia]ATV31838.1 hypothetical protein CTM46_09955 [Prevotella intermedia]PJI21219.1 hypothetical protein CTM45_10325 [Prevotella intermedia]
MWYLEKPSEKDLNTYKELFYEKIKNKIDKDGCFKFLLEEDNIERLLISEPKELYELNNKLMTEFIEDYSVDELKEYQKAKEKKVKKETSLKNKYNKLKEIQTIFNYNTLVSGNKDNSYKIAEIKGRNTCTYCNRQYTITLKKDGEFITRPQFDHWFPKSIFPLLALSFYNLIPSCSICNSSAKGEQIFSFKKLIHPYKRSSPETDFRFSYLPDGKGGWKIDLYNLKGVEKETFEVFKLKDIYNYHYKLEAKDLLDLAIKNNGTYIEWLLNNMEKKEIVPSYKEAYRLLFGTEYDIKKVLDRPFSKLKRDLLIAISELNPNIAILEYLNKEK